MNLASLSRFAFLTLPHYSMIAVANAIEALRMANRIRGTDEYRWQLVTPDGAPSPASNGLALHPTVPLAAMTRPDLVLICGGVDVREAVDVRVTAALRRLARDGVPLGGLCTGSFALAAAGLLRGRTCAIHWENLAAIEEEFPEIEFVRDLYAIDRDRVTCTGGVAPLSLMLALVEARVGPAVAAAIQAQFLLERAREGAEKQHARPGPAGHPKLDSAVRVIEAAVDAKLQTTEVARSVGLSPRQLERLFRRHLGQTPAAYAAGLRLDRARALLRETAMPVTAVASACGYVTPSRFSAAYRGRFGRSPRDERAWRRDDAHQQT
ncbi:MAG: GlxA family transcriptional regulator [Acetobacteraceae bacterium]|nr:GlxA family transcriptional regulator [Acetobacteraceae bacterium]